MPFGNRDLAVDLGTANTLVFERGRGIVVSEPSVIAVDADRGEVYAVGDEAHRMIGRTPATISATRPLRHGVIADFEVTEQMLRYFLRKAQASRWSRPRVVMCVPSGVTEVETRAVEEACLSAGARQVALIEEPIAAAIGAGLQIAEPTGHMVVDIGGGTSEVAVISMGEIVVETSLRLAGYDLDEAIMAYVRRHANLAIGQPSAEEIKIVAGSAYPMPQTVEVEVRGRELLSGLPRTVMLDSDEIREALAEPVQTIVDAVRETLDQTPPELSSDILIHGILLAGGGALLHGLAERLEHGDLDADADRRLAAHLRGGRRRRVARGVRGDRAPRGARPPLRAPPGRALAPHAPIVVRPPENTRVAAMKIRAAVLEEFGEPLAVQERRPRRAGPGEVLVRLAACGVCHTDLYTASGADPSGYAPTVLGHEGAGVVERVGEGVSLARGRATTSSRSSRPSAASASTAGRPAHQPLPRDPRAAGPGLPARRHHAPSRDGEPIRHFMG